MRTVCHSVGCAMGSLPLRMRESPLWMCPDNVHPMLREAEGKGVLGSRERAGRGQGEEIQSMLGLSRSIVPNTSDKLSLCPSILSTLSLSLSLSLSHHFVAH